MSTRKNLPRHRRCALRWLSLVACLGVACMAGAQRSESRVGVWRMVWHDEFDGAVIDTTKWGFDIGNGFFADSGKTYVSGWGNNELQCYTSAPDNVFVQSGAMHLRATATPGATCPYSSARVKTRRADGSALFAPRYGRFEFRAKLPIGRGVWPALWMLPQHETYGTWAASGEIDVMEARGQTPTTVLGTLHYGAAFPANVFTGKDYVLPDAGRIDAFHTYALEWEPGRIRWFVDGVAYQTQRFWWSRGRATAGAAAGAGAAPLNPWPAPFDRPFYLVMNVAVGGNFLGNPDSSTMFPAEMVVDFVRVYERRGGVGALARRGPGRIPPPAR
jgi:beta-glucanase (GH16 family)